MRWCVVERGRGVQYVMVWCVTVRWWRDMKYGGMWNGVRCGAIWDVVL